MEVKSIIKAGESQDIGQVIQNLIQDNISRLNTAFLAVVQEVKDNKVIVNQVIQDSENERLAIPSLLVGIIQTQNFKQSIKVQSGDFGLCVVCDCDISGYKQSGDKSKKLNDRHHDLIDSIFIPLSLYNSILDQNSILAEDDFLIESKKNLFLTAELLALKSKTTSLKKELEKLSDFISQIKTADGKALDPTSIQNFASWKNGLKNLFKE